MNKITEEFRNELVEFDMKADVSFPIFIQDLRVKYYEEFIKRNTSNNSIKNYFEEIEI